MQDLSQDALTEIMVLRNRWLADEIRRLSLDVISQGTFTCTECGEVAGEYIINHHGETLRLSTAEAYAFLQFALSP